MDDPKAMLQAIVTEYVSRCDDEELVAQLLNMQLDGDPRPRAGYDKLALLFTEADGTAMQTETRAAFLAVAKRQLRERGLQP